MAFTTGPDFLTGILGAKNSGNIFKENTDTRYGERIGDDGYLRTGPFTMDFLDSDGDGIDDRQQAGAGQPEIGSAPEASPIFEGGNVTPPVGGGGGDNPNRPMNNMPQDSYDMNPDGTITQYDASTGKTNTYEYNDPNASFPQRFFGTAMTAADMVPTSMDFLGSVAGSLYDRFIDPSDYDFNPNAFNSEQITGLANKYGLTGSYSDQLKAAQDFTQSNIDKKEALALGLEERIGNYPADFKGMVIDDGYSPGFPSNPLSDISNYTLAELEDEILGIDMSMTKQYNDAIKAREIAEANRIAERERLEAEQEAEKAAVDKAREDLAKRVAEANRIAERERLEAEQKADKAAVDKEREKQKNRDAFNERQKEQQKKEADKQKKEADKKAANNREQGRGPGGGGGAGGGGSSGGSSGGCFVEGTPIEMADGTTKEITTIELGEETKGGIVEAKMQFLPQNIYNYKDVLVSGSHWVVEDNQLIAVEDSKHGVLTDRVEPVYTFKTSNNRIWIYGIEFGDFETGSDADWEPHFEAVRQKLNKQLDEKTH